MSSSKNLSREEKDEFADQQMSRMRELNEKIMRRHQEVNQDKMDFERENPSAKVLPLKKDLEREEKRGRYSEKRIEREWDAGKTSELSDRGSEEKERDTRSGKRGGYYDEKRNRRDTNWESNYGNSNRRSVYSHTRNQDSRSYSQNKNTSWKPRGQHPNKSNNSFNRDYKNWNNVPQKQQFSATVDNDKVWRNDELNEARNKQSRVENWVQSISTENWSDSDEYSNSKKQSNSRTKTAKYGKYVEPDYKTYKSYSRRQNQEKIHKSSTSDSSYKEDYRPRYERFQTEHRKEYTSNARESDHHNYSREKFKKDRFKNRSPDRRNKVGTSASSTKQKDHEARNNHSRENKSYKGSYTSGNWADKSDFETETAWGSTFADKERNSTVKTTSGTWSDQEDKEISTTSKATRGGGTWSDQEADYEVGDNATKNITSGWDQCASGSKWTNPEPTVPKYSSWDNQKSSGKHSNNRANKNSEWTSSGSWSHQDSGRKPTRNQNRNVKKPDEKPMAWVDDKNHINNRLLRYAYGEDYQYGDFQGKNKKIEVIDLCSNSDSESESKNVPTSPKTANVQKCEEISDVKMAEVTQAANDSEIEKCGSHDIHYKEQCSSMKSPNKKNHDQEPCVLLNETEDSNSILLLTEDNDLRDSFLSDKCESDLNEKEQLKNSSSLNETSIPCHDEGLKGNFTENFKKSQKEKSPLNEKNRNIQQRSDVKDEDPVGTSKDFSNSFDLEEETIVPAHSKGNDSCSESSGNAKHIKETGNSPKEPKCPRHNKNSFETNPGALIDDGDNDWSTVTDENESDSAVEGGKST